MEGNIMGRKHKKTHRASQKTVCKMISEAITDEKKGNKDYLRLASKLSKRERKRVASDIARQERHHESRLEKLHKELMC